MTLFVEKIWDGPTTAGGLDSTLPFENSDILFFLSRVPGDELEIAAALEVDIQGVESIGGISIPVFYGTKEIPLDIDFIHTTEIVRIPQELSRTRLNMRLVMATSYSVNLAVYAGSQGVTDQDLQEALAACVAEEDFVDRVFQIVGRLFLIAGRELLFPGVGVNG